MQFLFACLLMLTVALGSAQAQTWSSASGKHKIDAEFVQLDGKRLQLRRRSNEKLIWVELKELSVEDQKRAKDLHREREESLASDPQEMLKNISVVVEIEGGPPTNAFWLDDDGAKIPTRPRQEITLIASGKPLSDVYVSRDINIKIMKDGDGDDILNDGMIRSLSNLDRHLHRPESRFYDFRPRGGVPVCSFKLSSPPESISTFAGTFRVWTGGKRTKFKIGDLNRLVGKTINHQALDDAGLKVFFEEPIMKNGEIDRVKKYVRRISVEGNLINLVDLYIADKKGKEAELGQHGYALSKSGKATYTSEVRSLSDQFLYIETVADPVDLEVPFEFHFMAPSKPKKKKTWKQNR